MAPLWFIIGSWTVLGVLVFVPPKVPSAWECFKQWVNIWYVELRVQVDPERKCPACGHRKEHKFVWSEVHQAIIHKCAACSAVFGERPVFAVESWRVDMVPIEEEPEQVGPRPPFGAPREPTRISEKKTVAR